MRSNVFLVAEPPVVLLMLLGFVASRTLLWAKLCARKLDDGLLGLRIDEHVVHRRALDHHRNDVVMLRDIRAAVSPPAPPVVPRVVLSNDRQHRACLGVRKPSQPFELRWRGAGPTGDDVCARIDLPTPQARWRRRPR